MDITLISSKFDEFDKIKKIKGQLIYAPDTGNAIYDISSDLRIDVSCTRQIDTEKERESIKDPKENLLYIVTSNKSMYRFDKTVGWLHVESFEAVQDILVSASSFEPMTICVNGVNYAPKTLAEYVYLNNGDNLQNAIDSLMKKGSKVVLEQKTVHIQLLYDKQKIVDIPFPISGYNIQKFPITLLLNDKKIDIDNYAIGREQIIFSDNITKDNKKGDIVTFIFAWANTLCNEGVDATSVNGKRVFIGDNVINIEDRIQDDLWIDTYYNEIKKWDYNKQSWELVISDRKRLIKHAINIVKYKEPTNYVNIGIKGFNPKKDMLVVLKNGIPLNKDQDYKLSSNTLFITPPEGYYWDTLSENIFTFIVLKNVPNIDYDDYSEDNFEYDEKYIAMQEKISNLEKTVQLLSEKIK